MDNLKQYYDKVVNINGTFPEFENLSDAQKYELKNSLGFAILNLQDPVMSLICGVRDFFSIQKDKS